MSRFNRVPLLQSAQFLLQNVCASNRRFVGLSGLSSLLMGVLPVLQLVLMQSLINALQLGESLQALLPFVFSITMLTLFHTVFTHYWTFYQSKVSLKFSLDVSCKILEKATRLSLRDYENSATYDLIQRAQDEGGDKMLHSFRTAIEIFSAGISLISYLLLLAAFRGWILLVIGIVPVLKFLFSNRINQQTFRISRRRTPETRRCWYINYLLTYGNFFKELTTFHLFSHFIDRFHAYRSQFNQEDLTILRHREWGFSLLSLLELCIDTGLLVYFLHLGVQKALLIGSVITYIQTVNATKSGVTNVLLKISQLMQDRLFLEQLREFFALKEMDETGKIPLDTIQSISVKHLTFSYPKATRPTLQDVSFHIQVPEKLLIVGKNGSGKTTLIKILLGFYEDYEGEVCINGRELREIDRISLRRRMSALFQDFVRYEATLRENVAYGSLSSGENVQDLEDLSEQFGLKDLWEDSPQGWDTPVGSWFDQGKNLSAGQWQKLALARVFAKPADVYLLDEPNAAMDVLTEQKMALACQKRLEGKMGIFIVHRLRSLVGQADQILVLERGKVVERGNHHTLLQKHGVYQTMYRRQEETALV